MFEFEGLEGVGFQFGLIPCIPLGFFLRVPKLFLQFPRWLPAKSIYAKIIANQIFVHAISNCKIRTKMCENSAFFYIFISCSII